MKHSCPNSSTHPWAQRQAKRRGPFQGCRGHTQSGGWARAPGVRTVCCQHLGGDSEHETRVGVTGEGLAPHGRGHFILGRG